MTKKDGPHEVSVPLEFDALDVARVLRKLDLTQAPIHLSPSFSVEFNEDDAARHARRYAPSADANVIWSVARQALRLWAANGEGVEGLQREIAIGSVDALTLAVLLSMTLEAGAVLADCASRMSNTVAGKYEGSGGGDAKSEKSGGNRQRAHVRAAWASGRFSSKAKCAEQECGSFSPETAKGWLKGAPNPEPWPARCVQTSVSRGAETFK